MADSCLLLKNNSFPDRAELNLLQRIFYQYEFGLTGKGMEIGVLDNNNDLITIRYLAEPEYFDENLPVVNRMIDSFRLGTT